MSPALASPEPHPNPLNSRLQGCETLDADPPEEQLSFAEIANSSEVWEYAALVTSLNDEILTLGQLYRDRADSEKHVRRVEKLLGLGRLHHA